MIPGAPVLARRKVKAFSEGASVGMFGTDGSTSLPQAMQGAATAYAAGDWPKAEQLCRVILQKHVDHLDALNLLGIIKAQTGYLEEAAVWLKRAVAAGPHNATSHNNYGGVLRNLKRFREALACYDRALQLEPAYADAHLNRGGVLHALGDFDAALESYDQAIAHRPDNAEAHYNRGVTLHSLGRTEEALTSYTRALSLRPRFAQAFYNQGIALHHLGRFAEALHSYDRALEIAANFAEALNNRGNTLAELGRYLEALRSYDDALRSNPSLADAYSNKGNVLTQLERFEEALQSYQCAMQINPGINWLCGAWLHTKLQLCDWYGIDAAVAEVVAGLAQGRRVTQPFNMLAVSDLLPIQRRAAEIFADEPELMHHPLAPLGKQRRRDVIRIGYYSADFHNHASALLLAGLIERHDRERFFVSAFSFGRSKPDQMTKRIESAVDLYVDIGAKSDREAAQISRDLEIDIAIDLKGFTGESRAGIFAHRAAPLQVAYLGYPGTMGASYIDYIVADRTVIPFDACHQYAEKVIYLPHSYQVNDRKRPEIRDEFSRTELGLPHKGFVFCCLNACYKITPATFAGWMRILNSVQGSVLWLLTDNRTAADNLCREAEKNGVSRARLVFAAPLPHSQHLARYRLADLFLDTFPCTAHTTASDALWCGLPIVTRLGESFVARVAASVLRAVGLPELVTSNQEEYEALAITLASDAPRLAAIKSRLAANRLTAPLFDTELTTKQLEQGYQQVYERYHAGLLPDHVQVAAD
jgi:predicted O-linked N-acetylglucosamine transferase (SPINDLY family)